MFGPVGSGCSSFVTFSFIPFYISSIHGRMFVLFPHSIGGTQAAIGLDIAINVAVQGIDGQTYCLDLR